MKFYNEIIGPSVTVNYMCNRRFLNLSRRWVYFNKQTNHIVGRYYEYYKGME